MRFGSYVPWASVFGLGAVLCRVYGKVTDRLARRLLG